MSAVLGEVAPERVAGVHLNLGSVAAGKFDDLTPAELANLEAEKEMQRTGRGYSGIQGPGRRRSATASPTPQQARDAWISEEFWATSSEPVPLTVRATPWEARARGTALSIPRVTGTSRCG
ncbi:hypothetical protein ACLMNJ_15940 [Streptomyces seoulensis]